MICLRTDTIVLVYVNLCRRLFIVDSCDASHVLLFSTRQLLTLDLSLSGVILGLPENPISSLSFCETSSQPVITLVCVDVGM